MSAAQLLAGAAVVLAIEGLCYAMFPAAMRRAITAVASLPEERLRAGGVVAAAVALAIAWILSAS